MFLRSLACSLLLASSTLVVPTLGCAQTADSGKPLASPAATANVTMGDVKIDITYNAPSVRGRKVMDGLIPYGKVWRTGANAATTITTSSDLHFGKLLVPAGTHTIYSYHSEKEQLLIINKQTGQWGTEYDVTKDLGRVPMMAKPMSSPQEVMSISFENTTPTSTELHIRWENTDEFVKITK
jgi:hypothetical protein